MAIINLYSMESLVHYSGEVFGRLRHHLSLLSLLGRQLWVESSRLIILEGEVSPLLTGVAYAKKMRGQLTTSSFIVSTLVIFGTWFQFILSFVGYA
jgi:hypothetical protein